MSPIHRVALPFAASPSAAPADAGAPVEQVDPDRLEPSGRDAARIGADRLLPRLRRRHPAHHRPRQRPSSRAHRIRRLQQGIFIFLAYQTNSTNYQIIETHPHPLSTAAPDQRAFRDGPASFVAGRRLYDGHRQGSAFGADLRARQSRDGHVGAHFLAAGQFQLPARRLRQSRRSAHRQTRHIPPHYIRYQLQFH